MRLDKNILKEKAKSIVKETKNVTIDVSSKTKDIVAISKNKIVSELDTNNDGNIDIEDIIIIGLKAPGVKVSRNDFLRKELKLKAYPETIELAIKKTPLQAGIGVEKLNPIADSVIRYERNCVSGISAALGVPGGVTMVATLPTDIIQYYGCMLRTAQKLMYLYGFPEINLEENNNSFDSETLNVLIICLGTMYGVKGANTAIKAMASGLAKGISKKIMSNAITKGTLYPIVRNIAKWFGVKMTKKLLVGAVNKSIPVVGGIIGGGFTYATFKPCCDKLKESLQNTMLSNQNYIETEEEKNIFNEISEI